MPARRVRFLSRPFRFCRVVDFRFFFCRSFVDRRFAPAELRRARELLGGPAGRRRGVLQHTRDHGETGRTAAGRRDEKPLRQRHTSAGDPSHVEPARRRRPAAELRLHKRELRQSTCIPPQNINYTDIRIIVSVRSNCNRFRLLQGYKGADKFYIACQAPMQSTLPDFWQMIWEQNTRFIMMLTSLTEKGVVSSCVC